MFHRSENSGLTCSTISDSFIRVGERAGIFDVEGVGDRLDDKGDTSGTAEFALRAT